MPRELRLGYIAHTLRSDWNNGNAHFLRGLMRALGACGHKVSIFEMEHSWSIENLWTEAKGASALEQFERLYPDLHIETFGDTNAQEQWAERLNGFDIVILHEWNPPSLAEVLLEIRERCGFRLLFHDTHHRASSTPEQMERFHLSEFDGVLAFGRVLEMIYRERYDVCNVWTFHEAADDTLFHPYPDVKRRPELVWIGNWGDGERSAEIERFLLRPTSALRELVHTTVYGVRYPEEGLAALRDAGVEYGGYLPNLDAPAVYAQAAATVHIPRQQYARLMRGIPTIRVFEALACGIPLISAPWQDCEQLFRPDDFAWADSCDAMCRKLRYLLTEPAAAEEQAARGLETILARHTCRHRAEELTSICEEILR